MKPTLNHNDLLLAFKTKHIKINDIIVAKPDNKTLIVKRVKNINSDKIEFSSDNKNIESGFSDVLLTNNFFDNIYQFEPKTLLSSLNNVLLS